MGAIYRREMGAFFTSGIAYVFLAVFYFFSGYFFYNEVLSSGYTDTSPVFQNMFKIVLFLIPILTMRLLSEEKKNRTDQGLLTAPVGLGEIVVGKYLAALTIYIIAESIIFVYAVILGYLGTVAWAALLGNYFAMLLLGAAFIAVGIFISSLTENQMTAAVFSMAVLFFLYLFGSTAEKVSKKWMYDIIKELSFYDRYVEFTQGVFNLTSVLFYLSTAFLFNFFTVRVLEKRRWS
ncbi:ABC transporter permease subunit [uncultured Ruminococcus sp.]|uniref:ABC transporter permease subunit n=1 Tax=uncultured Ruminococcus sp. TaxID=165186 RepID=UPI002627AFC2|nr:ABC transporter permease subunit [uncultured Ruminococcus sp.]